MLSKRKKLPRKCNLQIESKSKQNRYQNKTKKLPGNVKKSNPKTNNEKYLQTSKSWHGHNIRKHLTDRLLLQNYM